MNNSALHFQSLLAQAITKLVTIFGPDVTYATLSHIREIRLDSTGKITAIEGVDEQIVTKLITLFSSLSPEVTKDHIVPIFASYTATLPSIGEQSVLPSHTQASTASLLSVDHQSITHTTTDSVYLELC